MADGVEAAVAEGQSGAVGDREPAGPGNPVAGGAPGRDPYGRQRKVHKCSSGCGRYVVYDLGDNVYSWTCPYCPREARRYLKTRGH